MPELARLQFELLQPADEPLALYRKRVQGTDKRVLIVKPGDAGKAERASVKTSFPEELLSTYQVFAGTAGYRLVVDDLPDDLTDDLAYVTAYELKQLPLRMEWRLAKGRFYLKRISRSEYAFYDSVTQRARFGPLTDIQADLEHVRQTGNLPPRSTVRW